MINISKDDAKLFEQNGFTKEQIGATVNHYREMGLSDDEIQAKINDKISSFTSQAPQIEKPKGIDLTPSGLVDKAVNTITAGIETPFRMAKDNQTAKEAFKNAYEDSETRQAQIAKEMPFITGSQDFLTDVATYGAIPVLRGGVAKTVLNPVLQGGVPMALESLKAGGNPLGGLAGGTALAGGLTAAASGIPYVGNVVKGAIANPNVQRVIGKGLEALTSVPQKFTQRALDAELAGNSILSGKFNPETAYRPIEQKLREAKGMLPNAADFGNEYYKLGQKALQGMENLKEQAGAEIIKALEKLNNKEVQNGGIQAAANSIIKSFGKGGVYNSALEEAPGIVNYINDSLSKEGLTLMDLHRIKEALYNKGYAAEAAREGTTAQVARGVANQINNYLRKVSPDYAKPNDVYSTIIEATRGLDGQTTMGSKLSDVGSVNSAKSGLDQRLKAIDNLLPQQNKFYKQAQNIVKNEKEINDIVNTVGKQYERNPRLLANRTDEAFEMALEDLQAKTGVNFMDDLNDVRAREALEKWFPGQGGGSGSEQGFGNLLRTGLIGGAPTAALLTHNPAALAGLGLVSPKLTAQGTIKNLGKLYNSLGNQIPEGVQNILRPLAIKLLAPSN